jgi:hypothetical protein
VAAWYRLAQEARAILNVVANVREKKPARHGDWQMVVSGIWYGQDGGHPWLDPLNQPANAVSAKAYLEDSVNRWLAYGAVQPILAWSTKEPPMITFDGYGLFGALALQLLAVVSGTGWDICSVCGRIFDPGSRRRNPNRRHYCDECRERKIPQRDAMRDLRDRRQAKGTSRGSKTRLQRKS